MSGNCKNNHSVYVTTQYTSVCMKYNIKPVLRLEISGIGNINVIFCVYVENIEF